MRMSLAFPERRVLRTVLYPSCFCLREKKKNINDENTLLAEEEKEKEEREREREREPARKNFRSSNSQTEKGRHNVIPNLLVLDPKERERSYQKQSFIPYRVLPRIA